MERIIRDVLTLARGEAAVDPSSTVDLETVASDAWTTVDTDTASLTVEDDLPTVEADPDRLRRLLENLFRNSVEHGRPAPTGTRDAGGRVERDDRTEPAVGVRVGATSDGFFVADDGTGIPPEERELVFEPGYSSHDAGTGLGLTIVERIAAAHGWTVSVTDGDTGGARIDVRFEAGDDSDCDRG
jgi:signal transduction histidine kinase